MSEIKIIVELRHNGHFKTYCAIKTCNPHETKINSTHLGGLPGIKGSSVEQQVGERAIDGEICTERERQIERSLPW